MKNLQKILILCFLLIASNLFSQNVASAELCCLGLRGNADGDPNDFTDVDDLVYMVNFAFKDGSAVGCLEEGDVTVDGIIDVDDLVFMVNFAFKGGPAPGECQALPEAVFVDDFEGPAGQSLNLSKWGFDVGTDWGNAQLEYDTDRTSNVSLDGNGNLAIIAREESYLGQSYTSGRIVTRNLFEFTYGKVEARIKLPVGQGIWPAFWLLGSNINEVGWPQCGEVDIMEYLGHESNKAYGTLHGPGYSGGGGVGQSYILESGNFNTDFHIFAIEWEQEEIRWYIDDVLYLTIGPEDLGGNEWVFDHPFYIILNVAVGGHWPGSPDGSTVFPQTMLIDYVRVYDGAIIHTTGPTTSAPTPPVDPSDVVSLYSDAYSDVTIDTWSADWDNANVTDVVVDSDDIKKYTLTEPWYFAGIEFSTSTIDATGMTHFHMDVWTPDATASPSVFKIKLVDYGADGVYEGSDNVEHEIILDENTMNTDSWVSLDIPLTDFVNLTTKGHIAQLIISGDLRTFYVDNIYFYDSGLPPDPTAPTVSAPAPTVNPADVISLYSDAYTDVTVDTWSAVWDNADVEDYMIGSDNIKKYSNIVYAGIEFKSTTIDATAMTHFHIDIWTPDQTAAPSTFRIKLVDFGANGVWEESGDNVEHELSFDENIMNTGSWVTLDIPLTDFINLTTKGHLAQLIISGDPNTVYVDNIYLHK